MRHLIQFSKAWHFPKYISMYSRNCQNFSQDTPQIRPLSPRHFTKSCHCHRVSLCAFLRIIILLAVVVLISALFISFACISFLLLVLIWYSDYYSGAWFGFVNGLRLYWLYVTAVIPQKWCAVQQWWLFFSCSSVLLKVFLRSVREYIFLNILSGSLCLLILLHDNGRGFVSFQNDCTPQILLNADAWTWVLDTLLHYDSYDSFKAFSKQFIEWLI